jgi:hypothetical protein
MARWVGYIVPMGERLMQAGIWWESQKIKDYYEDLEVFGRVVLNGS